MRLTIAAIGKSRHAHEDALIAGYAKRLTWPLEFLINDGRKLKNKKEETAWLLQATKHAERRLALDEQGRDMTSAQFAEMFANIEREGITHVAFLIGGADGLDKSQLPRDVQTLCFGRMTWPHMLVRVMLTEQIYRAESILKNHPYHRE